MTVTTGAHDSKHDSVITPAPGLIDKTTVHPLGLILLGEVVAVQWLNQRLLFYYGDGRIARISINNEGNFVANDHKVPMC